MISYLAAQVRALREVRPEVVGEDPPEDPLHPLPRAQHRIAVVIMIICIIMFTMYCYYCHHYYCHCYCYRYY